MSLPIHHLDELDFTSASWRWPFAAANRREIDDFFRRECEENPALWNGRVMLLGERRIAGRVMTGRFFEADYAAMLAALDWDAMGEEVRACFPAAALFGSDGGLIVGEMAAHTRNAGQVLLPSGSLDRGDVVGGRIDFLAAMGRELEEETGIDPATVAADRGWFAVEAGARLPIVKVLRAQQTAPALQRRIAANLASQPQPEFREVFVVHGPSAASEHMPSWLLALLPRLWEGAQA